MDRTGARFSSVRPPWSIASSKALNPPTCRSSSRRASCSCSILKPQRRWGSTYRTRCSHLPTRWSNDAKVEGGFKMKLPRRRFLHLAAGAAALPAVSSIAWAQAYPTRTVRFILPFGAGSASDTTARLFAERLSARWGKPVVVENRPGGDGLVSLDAFVGAHEDHTMWFGPAGTFNVLPYQHDTLPFDPKRDLNPIASVSEVVLAVSTPVSMNVNSIDELVAIARAQPGKLNAAAANGISDFL